MTQTNRKSLVMACSLATITLGIRGFAFAADDTPNPQADPAPAPDDTQPRDKSPVPGPSKVIAISGIGQLTLNWEPVAGVASYNVYAESTSPAALASTAPSVRTKNTSVVVANRPNGVQVWLVVRPVTTIGEGRPSKPISAVPSLAAAPVDVKASGGDGTISVTWTSVGAASYHIDVFTDPYGPPVPGLGLDSIPGNSPTITETIKGLKNNTPYFIGVSAVDGAGTQTKAPKMAWAVPLAPAVSTPTDTTPLLDIAESGCSDLPQFQFLAPKFKASTENTASKAVALQQPATSAADATTSSSAKSGKTSANVGPSIAEQNSATIREVQAVLKAEVATSLRGKTPTADGEYGIALKCNGWLAAKTLAQQATSSTQSVQAFPKFATSIADNSQLVTTHFVTAFTPTWLHNDSHFTVPKAGSSHGEKYPALDADVNSHWYNDIGVDLSSSVPISSATLSNYATQELLMRDGGLVNLYASFAGRNYSNVAYDWGNRKANLDRLYWIDILNDEEPATASETLAFISHGLGIKALKTALTGTANSLGAQATSYLGVGFDGPLFLASQDATSASKGASNTPAGMLSFEVYIGENYLMNGEATNTLLSKKVSGRSYAAFGANLSLYVTGNIGIQVQYAAAQDNAIGRAVGHVAMLSISYTKAPTSPSTNTITGTSLGPQAN